MRVPFLDLGRIHAPVRDALVARLTDVVDSQRFILGPEVEGFERALADYLGVAHAIGVSSGSDALLAALMALGVGDGDEVIVPSFTFFATAGAVARLGARPVFADIDPATFLLSPERVCERFTARTEAVIPVHLFGRTADIGGLRDVCRDHGVSIVEDAAQAIGAADAHGGRAGGLGKLGCFSFFPAKNLGALGDGGAITTNDAGLAERLRVLRVHGARPKYHHQFIGGNFRLDALQAAALSVKLPTLDAAIEARQRNATRYGKLFDVTKLLDRGDVVLPEAGPGRHVWHQFVIRARDRDGLRAYLAEQGVQTMIYYPQPLHLQPCFSRCAWKAGDLPETERATAEVLALPIYEGLTPLEQEYVVARIAAFYEED